MSKNTLYIKHAFFERINFVEIYRNSNLLKDTKGFLFLTREISLYGLSSITDIEFKVNDIFIFYIKVGLYSEKVMCRVASCKRQNDLYDTELEFINLSRRLHGDIKNMETPNLNVDIA